MVARFGISDAICSSVAAPFSEEFLSALRDAVPGMVAELTPDIPLPVNVIYGSRDTLGADRVATAVAAADLAAGRRAIMVDAGTAITIDRIDADGDFIGGSISPGIRLRFGALHEHTARLPYVNPDGATPKFGHDTETAIRCGVMRGIAAEIEAAASDFDAMVILSGGDAHFIAPLLSLPDNSFICVKDAVGLGLSIILHHFKYTQSIDNHNSSI